MLFCPISREQFLDFLPKGGEVAEIGVANGEFSQLIWDIVRPQRLHLIDAWKHQDRADYASDPANVSDEKHEAKYRDVLGRFTDGIAEGRVSVHRMNSSQAAGLFRDRQLDWVYIDALHSFEGVLADLVAYRRKVNSEGFILGHDYTNDLAARRKHFDVVRAVNAFVATYGYHFLALTGEHYPTYVLVEKEDAPSARLLVAKLAYNLPFMVEIRNFPKRGDFQQRLFRLQDKTFVVPSF